MKIKLPDDVKNIIKVLTEHGYEAYAVGGCVRDSIIHRVPGDWDITTSAKPEQVKGLFRRTVDTGIAHGTVTIMIGSTGYEVTTYRIDGEYEDCRHPVSVEFTASLEEDLKRRDFTINAMAYNDEKGIVDLFNGEEDLKSGIIRCVGNAKERFTEDALRMLRAVRFSAQLGYDIAEDTCNAVKELALDIGRISKERIHTELNKMLLSDNPDYIMKACELGITKVVFPVFDKILDKKQVLKFVKNVPDNIAFRYAAIMCNAGRPRTASMLRELKLDNATIDMAATLVDNHGMTISTDERIIRHSANRLGKDMFNNVLEYEKAWYTTCEDAKSLSEILKEMEIYNVITARGDCLSMKDMAVKGSDLIKCGIQPGKEMGIILGKLLEEVLNEPELNKKEILLDSVKHIDLI